MLTTGLALGGLTVASFYFIFMKLPRKIRNFLKRHMLLTDGITMIAALILFGTSVTGLFAAVWCGIMMSLMLHLANNPHTAAMLQAAADKWKEFKGKLVAWIERHFEIRSNVIDVEFREAA